MNGSMIISGRRTGQVRLDLKGDVIDFVPTNPKCTFEDILSDAQEKLESLKANPSPIESEILFLEQWLKLALEPRAALEKSKEIAKGPTPIDVVGKKVESVQ